MKNKKNWIDFDALLDMLPPKQCAVTIADKGKFYLYGEPLCPVSQTNMIMCRIEGANQLVGGSQVVVPFCRI